MEHAKKKKKHVAELMGVWKAVKKNVKDRIG